MRNHVWHVEPEKNTVSICKVWSTHKSVKEDDLIRGERNYVWGQRERKRSNLSLKEEEEEEKEEEDDEEKVEDEE